MTAGEPTGTPLLEVAVGETLGARVGVGGMVIVGVPVSAKLAPGGGGGGLAALTVGDADGTAVALGLLAVPGELTAVPVDAVVETGLAVAPGELVKVLDGVALVAGDITPGLGVTPAGVITGEAPGTAVAAGDTVGVPEGVPAVAAGVDAGLAPGTAVVAGDGETLTDVTAGTAVAPGEGVALFPGTAVALGKGVILVPGTTVAVGAGELADGVAVGTAVAAGDVVVPGAAGDCTGDGGETVMLATGVTLAVGTGVTTTVPDAGSGVEGAGADTGTPATMGTHMSIGV